MKHSPEQSGIVAHAYKQMAEQVGYRPAAPSDGCGHIFLTKEGLADPGTLEVEAYEYAKTFLREEDTREFFIGVSDLGSLAVLVYTIEAARLLCGELGGYDRTIRLLRLALEKTEELSRVHHSFT